MSMLREQSLVPFTTSDLPNGKFLIFAPHPDDETFGCGGTILKLRNAQQEVEIALVSNGEQAGDPETRISEFRSVTSALGVRKVYQLNQPDGGLENNINTLESFINVLIKSRPDMIFFPSPLEYHIDHRTTAYLVWEALQSTGFSGKAFSYEIGNQSPANYMVDITAVMSDKVQLMQRYASQLVFNDYPEKIYALNRSRSYTLPPEVKFAEAFFLFENIDVPIMLAMNRQFSLYGQGTNNVKMPWVSVLVRTKDRPYLLKNALTSVMQQNYPYIELVCVNDGGINIDEIVHLFPFKKNIVHNNIRSKGRGGAANDLLSLATGDYLIFLDDDDTIDSDHIENLLQILLHNPSVEVAYSGVRIGNGVDITPAEYNEPYDVARLRRGNYIPIHAVLFSKTLIDKGCRFDESLEIYEDWDFWLQLSQYTPFYHSYKISATYNIFGTSGASNSAKRVNLREWIGKIYEKWLPVWSGLQLLETYEAIEHKSPPVIVNEAQSDKVAEQLLSEVQMLRDWLKQTQSSLAAQAEWGRDILTRALLSHDPFSNMQRNFFIRPARYYTQGCIECFKKVFGADMPPSLWYWKYGQVEWRNVCAVDKDDNVIGFYGCVQRNILAFGEPKIALQPADTMVVKEHRGRLRGYNSMFVMFQTWINFNRSGNHDVFITYGFPNIRHYLLGEKINIYEKADSITQLRWRLGVQYESISEHLHVVIDHEVDPQEIDQLWHVMAHDFQESIIVCRDFSYVNYRYLEHPVYRYKYVFIRSEDTSLLGFFVLKEEEKCIKLMDIVCAKKNIKNILTAICEHLASSGFDFLDVWVTTSHKDLFLTPGVLESSADVIIPMDKKMDKRQIDRVENRWFLLYGDTDFM
ncbi:GNAT family N-acetyltransferase [Acidithiobacillus montserratensis]|uniref:GNAT family N-acetyltransferase n=1 Tax=Acidithiobacillus montserratensis TaxID=2729135 RepID=A0ACD5HHX6_9PROT|nr:PIG-L family deacetylase [Acidithiobacillus montserratensis]MBN2679566.1 GNAT family N-acetyltransferase [Acidithiobacillaceae bacterium]MBU2746943.1 GNAT family N-acetyltransferase [Acidithiobacillus montserratensis]